MDLCEHDRRDYEHEETPRHYVTVSPSVPLGARKRSVFGCSVGPVSQLFPEDDFAGRLFALLEDDGECIAIRFGEVSQGDVRWYVRSHARYDGIGGLVDVLRSANGHILGDMPELSGAARPPCSLDAGRRLAELWHQPAARWNQLPRSGARQLVVHGRRPAYAWTVLDSGRARALQASRKAVKASVGGYLLSCLNAGLTPLLSHDDGPALWVVPVNMRGVVRRRRPLANHLSFVPILLREEDGPRAATRQIRARLADGSHFLLHSAASAVASIDYFAPSVTAFADCLRGRSVGLFSSLGAWQVTGLDKGTAWILSPPVTRFLPLGAGVVTVNGALGLMLQAYPSLTMQDSEVNEWLQAWIDQIDRQIASMA